MSTQRYTETSFEDHVVERLTASGYALHPPGAYDRDLVVLPADLVAFLHATQPDAARVGFFCAQKASRTLKQPCRKLARPLAPAW